MAVRVRVTKFRGNGPIETPIHTEYIKLQDFMKLCDAVPSGGMAKNFIQNGEVRVNGETETRRGRKLRPGDEVAYLHTIWRVVAHDP